MEDPFREAGLTAGDLLIETMLWDGARLHRAERHRERLARSAARLGFRHDPERIAAALADLPGGIPLRLRLTLGRDGRTELGRAPLPAAPALWQVRLAARRLDAEDPLRQVKTTARHLYDRDRAALPAGTGEWIYANQRGEIAEGTISSVFFDLGAGLRTPPLDSGCLPGCLRAELLAEGRVQEAVLPLADLPRARLWCGNSLRGLIPARLIQD